jgi:glycosyltransferase involved in cell wall biosynthesis
MPSPLPPGHLAPRPAPTAAPDQGPATDRRFRQHGAREPRSVPRRILFAVTADQSLTLLKGFPQHMAALDWDVHVVSSPGPGLENLSRSPGVTAHGIVMAREPSPVRDLLALFGWVRLLRRVRPAVLSAGTPKVGFLGTLAGFLTRTPVRVYLLRGLRWETTTGLRRWLLVLLERLVCRLATRVVCVSPSLREVAERRALTRSSKLEVLGPGSSNGVDIQVRPLDPADRTRLRHRYFPACRTPVLGFVGRVTPDKGLVTLAAALSILSGEGRAGDCIIIGGDDGPVSAGLRGRLDRSGWRVVHTGHVEEVTELTQVMDVLCLPSLREGFPNVVLEAAALGIPCVGSDATGVRDAIRDGETGLLFPSGNPTALATQLRRILIDPELVLRLGAGARQHVRRHYARDLVWRTQARYYEDLLTAAAVPGSRIGRGRSARRSRRGRVRP